MTDIIDRLKRWGEGRVTTPLGEAQRMAIGVLRQDAKDAIAEIERLRGLINSPQTANWLEAVPLEAAHQIERYPAHHDANKTAWDWFWLIGYLAQKAAAADAAGDTDKAKHHTISTGAALLNWHRHLTETPIPLPEASKP